LGLRLSANTCLPVGFGGALSPYPSQQFGGRLIIGVLGHEFAGESCFQD
jgi:hypothetical protein